MKSRHVAYWITFPCANPEDGVQEHRGFLMDIPDGVSIDKAVSALADRLSRLHGGRRPITIIYQAADGAYPDILGPSAPAPWPGREAIRSITPNPLHGEYP